MNILRVLVVDDEPGMRYAVVRALQSYQAKVPHVEGEIGFEVSQADSGEAALALLESQTPDIMLLDHKMGGMSGVEVLNELRHLGSELLTIMITAFATIETAVRATKSGAFDFVAKPFTPEELRDTIKKAATHLMVQRQAERLAEEKRRVRFEFISVLGHELKSPLGAIESYLMLLKQRVQGDDLGKYETMIDRCLLRAAGMRKLILDLLDMTRLESGEKKREIRTVDVVEVAKSALEALKPQADERKIVINLDAPAALEMRADRGEIEMVLNNLVSNAVKYNRPGGRVDVKIGADEQNVNIAVSDTGIGLTEEEARRLFNDFARIKNEKTRDIPGSGLGLSIIKKIADLYHGSVGVQSEPNVGSTFKVVLQRHAEPTRGVDGKA